MSFKRNYRLTVTIGDKVLQIEQPLRIAFEATKSMFGQANKLTCKIYNLADDKRGKLSFEPEDGMSYIRITLAVGYGDDLLGIFRGNVWRAKSEKSGTDFVTTIESIDGGQDYFSAFTSKTVKGDVATALLNDMANTSRGSLIPLKTLVRPKVLVGSSSRLFDEQLDDDQTMFIDNEKLYVMDTKKYLGTDIPEVSAQTGLMTTPERAKQMVAFTTVMNPLLRIGHRCEFISKIAPSLSGVYRIDTITYRGDNYGDDWNQTCEARYSRGMAKL